MAEKLLGPDGPERRRRLRLLPVLLLLAGVLLVVVAQAAGADPESPPYTIINDENGPNDVPGQKDLNLQGVDSSQILAGTIKVLWNWDETSISGNNTLDACTLFDTDPVPNGRADVAVCVTAGGSPVAFQAKTVYTCGDDRVDRCSSPIAPKTVSADTTCSITNPSATDPFGGTGKARGASFPNDIRGKCTIKLADINATTALLINTCSYPSQQPNSDPSDCVLIPRDAFLKIVKDAGGETTSFNFTVTGGASATPTIAGGSNTTIPIKSATATTVTEALPSADWEFVSATCTGGTNNGTAITNGRSGITAASDATVTCTFVNALKAPGVLTIEKSCPNGAHAATDRFQPKDGTANAGNAIACGGSTTYTTTPGVAYNITEEAGVTTPPTNLANYTTSITDTDCSGTLARGATATCTIVNTLKAAPQLTIEKSCPNGAAAATDRFQAQNNGSNVGTALACGGSVTITLTPDTGYDITEVGAGTPAANLANYTTDLTDADCKNASGLPRGATTPTCTIVNTLKADPQLTITKSCPNGKHATTDRFQAQNNNVNVGTALDCGGSVTITLTPDTAYSIGEVGAGTPAANLANYTTDLTDADCANASGLPRGAATPTCTIVNTLRTFTVVTFVCEGDELHASSVTFDGDTKTSSGNGASLPTGVTEAKLCSDTTVIDARFTGKTSGTKNGSVTITP